MYLLYEIYNYLKNNYLDLRILRLEFILLVLVFFNN